MASTEGCAGCILMVFFARTCLPLQYAIHYPVVKSDSLTLTRTDFFSRNDKPTVLILSGGVILDWVGVSDVATFCSNLAQAI